MTIGIDISQTSFEQTGVSNYLINLVESLINEDKNNKYILFFSSFRRNVPDRLKKLESERVKIKTFKAPPLVLDLLWNRLHTLPIESLIGKVDLFITSDWTEPPSRGKKATIIYDLIVYKYPNETDSKIVEVQKRKLKWVKKESDLVFAISESSKKDAQHILGIEGDKIKVIYPGL